MKINKHTFADSSVFIIRILLGVIFVLSSIPKIKQPYDFLASVYNYEIVGPKLGMFAAMAMPWLELFVGICLVGGLFLSGAFLAAMAMGAMFVYVIISALYQGLEISCGCFGASSTDIINYTTLIRAGFVLVLALAGYALFIFGYKKTEDLHTIQ